MKRLRLLPLLLLTVLVTAEDVGPFSWSRHLHDPAAPVPAATCRDGSVETASLVTGDTAAGVIGTDQWSGDNQAGGGSWSGNTLVGPAGKNYYVGLGDWSIRLGSDYAGEWVYYSSFMQDAHVTFGFSAAPIAQGHGQTRGLAGAVPGNAIVVELSWRNWMGGGTRWQTGWYRGNPAQVGVWQVPAGMSLQQAQGDAANRLGEMTVWTETRPTDALRLKLQVQAGGAWQLRSDFDGDGQVDLDLVSGEGGNKASDFADVTEANGLVITAAPAGGAHGGEVCRTATEIAYAESASETIDIPYNRRPLDADMIAQSQVSPVVLHGKRWSANHGVTLESGGADVPVTILGDKDWFAEVPLADGAATGWTVTQDGTPPTVVAGATWWTPTDLYTEGSITIRAGDSLLLTYRGGYDEGDRVFIDAYGDGSLMHEGEAYANHPTQYNEPGTYVAAAFIDVDGNGERTAAEEVGHYTVHVVEVLLPDRITAQVGYARPVIANTGRIPADQVSFTTPDATLLTVTPVMTAGNVALFTVKPKTRGTPVLEARLQSDPDRLAAWREVQEFTIELGARQGMVVSGSTGVGRTWFRMTPYLDDLVVTFDMFSSRSSFKGGVKTFTVDTDGNPSSNGEPGMVVKDHGGEPAGVFIFELNVAPSEDTYCFKAWPTEFDETQLPGQLPAEPAGEGDAAGLTAAAADAGSTANEDGGTDTKTGKGNAVNGKVCKVSLFKSLVFIKADDVQEDEVEVADNPESWFPGKSWFLRSDEVCKLNDSNDEDCTDLYYHVLIDETPELPQDRDEPHEHAGFDGAHYSDRKACDEYCEEVEPAMDTGTYYGHYTTKVVQCDDTCGESGGSGSGIGAPSLDDGEVNEAEGGEFWVSKLDAHGTASGTRDQFPNLCPTLPRRAGTLIDPVIRLDSGGMQDETARGGVSLYGTVECPKSNVWTMTAMARDCILGKQADYVLRWRNGTPGADPSKPSHKLLPGVPKDSGATTVTTDPLPVGHWYPRLEVWTGDPKTRGSKLVAWAEVHTINVEQKPSELTNEHTAVAHESVKVGRKFHLTNISQGQEVDACLSINEAAITNVRGRVSLDGYPQNEYWVKSGILGNNDLHDLPQVIRVKDGNVPVDAYLQGYDEPSSYDETLELEVHGQALLEVCESCLDLDGSPVHYEWWHTDYEPFASGRLEYIDNDEIAVRRDLLPVLSPRPIVTITGSYVTDGGSDRPRVHAFGYVRSFVAPIDADHLVVNGVTGTAVVGSWFISEPDGPEGTGPFTRWFIASDQIGDRANLGLTIMAINAVENFGYDAVLAQPTRDGIGSLTGWTLTDTDEVPANDAEALPGTLEEYQWRLEAHVLPAGGTVEIAVDTGEEAKTVEARAEGSSMRHLTKILYMVPHDVTYPAGMSDEAKAVRFKIKRPHDVKADITSEGQEFKDQAWVPSIKVYGSNTYRNAHRLKDHKGNSGRGWLRSPWRWIHRDDVFYVEVRGLPIIRNRKDTVFVRAFSETDPTEVILELTETGNDSGIFRTKDDAERWKAPGGSVNPAKEVKLNDDEWMFYKLQLKCLESGEYMAMDPKKLDGTVGDLVVDVGHASGGGCVFWDGTIKDKPPFEDKAIKDNDGLRLFQGDLFNVAIGIGNTFGNVFENFVKDAGQNNAGKMECDILHVSSHGHHEGGLWNEDRAGGYPFAFSPAGWWPTPTGLGQQIEHGFQRQADWNNDIEWCWLASCSQLNDWTTEDRDGNGNLTGNDLNGDGIIAGLNEVDINGDGIINDKDHEDQNHNGLVDPGEDFDGDGNLDVHEDLNGNAQLDTTKATIFANVGGRSGRDHWEPSLLGLPRSAHGLLGAYRPVAWESSDVEGFYTRIRNGETIPNAYRNMSEAAAHPEPWVVLCRREHLRDRFKQLGPDVFLEPPAKRWVYLAADDRTGFRVCRNIVGVRSGQTTVSLPLAKVALMPPADLEVRAPACLDRRYDAAGVRVLRREFRDDGYGSDFGVQTVAWYEDFFGSLMQPAGIKGVTEPAPVKIRDGDLTSVYRDGANWKQTWHGVPVFGSHARVELYRGEPIYLQFRCYRMEHAATSVVVCVDAVQAADALRGDLRELARGDAGWHLVDRGLQYVSAGTALMRPGHVFRLEVDGAGPGGLATCDIAVDVQTGVRSILRGILPEAVIARLCAHPGPGAGRASGDMVPCPRSEMTGDMTLPGYLYGSAVDAGPYVTCITAPISGSGPYQLVVVDKESNSIRWALPIEKSEASCSLKISGIWSTEGGSGRIIVWLEDETSKTSLTAYDDQDGRKVWQLGDADGRVWSGQVSGDQVLTGFGPAAVVVDAAEGKELSRRLLPEEVLGATPIVCYSSATGIMLRGGRKALFAVPLADEGEIVRAELGSSGALQSDWELTMREGHVLWLRRLGTYQHFSGRGGRKGFIFQPTETRLTLLRLSDLAVVEEHPLVQEWLPDQWSGISVGADGQVLLERSNSLAKELRPPVTVTMTDEAIKAFAGLRASSPAVIETAQDPAGNTILVLDRRPATP